MPRLVVVLAHYPRILGAWADERHLAPEHVVELRQFINFESAQKRAEAEDARVPRAADRARPRALLRVHRAELVHDEHLATEADALRPVNDGATAGETDAN